MTTQELHAFLENPEVFSENTCPAHSDHFFYENEKDIEKGDEFALKQSLNGTWKFMYSKNLFERPENFYEEKFSLSDFDEITVPGHIELQGYDRPHYTNAQYPWDGSEELDPPFISKDYAPVGSYVKDVSIDKNLKGKRIFISFQGVETGFRLFVNGKYVGYAEDSFTPSEFELTDFIANGKNRIAVEVYKRTSASWLEDQDMWRFFGIFREVYLYAIPKLHVNDICIKAGLDASYSKGILDVSAKTFGMADYASLELYDKEDKVFEAPMQISGDNLTLHMEGLVIKAWSAEEPNLYEARITLKDASKKVIEIATTRIGFRNFELKDKLMLINGKRIIFRGVDRHEFSALHGRAATKEEMLWDIKTFKRNNINAVRTSHYPNDSYWYRLCDEYGIYVIDETNLETHGTWTRQDYMEKKLYLPGSLKEWKGAVLDRAKNMLMRDRNHASVLMWSLGNESYGGDNFMAMHDFFRENDDTRIVHYEGTIHFRETDACSDIESKMYDKPQDIRRYLQNDPQKPFISCEYMHAMGNSLGGMKLYTDLEDEFEMYQGGFIWDYLDQALWQEHNEKMRLAYGGDFGDRPTEYCFSTDGIVFANRVESPKCKEVKQLYSNVRINVTESNFTIENRNLFVNLSDYYFVYSVIANGSEIVTGNYTDVTVTPGEKLTIDVKPVEIDASMDVVYRVLMCQKKATKWADRDYMVTFGEYVRLAAKNPVLTNVQEEEFKHVALTGLSNVGCSSEDFSVIFAKADKYPASGMVSIKDCDEELVTFPPQPIFYRAYTDNDKGFRLGAKANIWHMLSEYQLATLKSFTKEGDAAVAVYDYTSPMDESLHSTIEYRVHPQGRIEVNMKYYGKENLPMLPLYGFDMRLDKKYNNIEYFGKGPFENYRDRNNGSMMDVYHTTVEENLTPYLVPQEVGNRTDVRYVKVTNEDGHGLLFAAKDDKTFELGFLPYSTQELLSATHLDELPNRNYSFIRIMAGQMGVGGDDSWGAPVQEMFRLDSSKDLELSFEIRVI